MDFIVGLPISKFRDQECDAILVLVDWYMKYAWYLPVSEKINSLELADLFVAEVVTCFGAPKTLISNRGSLFMSHF